MLFAYVSLRVLPIRAAVFFMVVAMSKDKTCREEKLQECKSPAQHLADMDIEVQVQDEHEQM